MRSQLKAGVVVLSFFAVIGIVEYVATPRVERPRYWMPTRADVKATTVQVDPVADELRRLRKEVELQGLMNRPRRQAEEPTPYIKPAGQDRNYLKEILEQQRLDAIKRNTDDLLWQNWKRGIRD